jgi:hypothetical protein
VAVRANQHALSSLFSVLIETTGAASHSKTEALGIWVEMVEVKCADIPVVPAHATLSAKLGDQNLLAFLASFGHGYRATLFAPVRAPPLKDETGITVSLTTLVNELWFGHARPYTRR